MNTEVYLGLVMDCPYKGGNPYDCILFEIRKLPLKDKIKWWQDLAEHNKIDIIQTHQFCLAKKVLK